MSTAPQILTSPQIQDSPYAGGHTVMPVIDEPYATFADIIKNWPGGTVGFAEDAGIATVMASSWRQRSIIPPQYWSRITKRAAARGFVAVTLQLLAGLEAARKGLNA